MKYKCKGTIKRVLGMTMGQLVKLHNRQALSPLSGQMKNNVRIGEMTRIKIIWEIWTKAKEKNIAILIEKIGLRSEERPKSGIFLFSDRSSAQKFLNDNFKKATLDSLRCAGRGDMDLELQVQLESNFTFKDILR